MMTLTDENLNETLTQFIPDETLKDLKTRRPWLHFCIAIRQLLLLIGIPFVIFFWKDNWLICIPLSLLYGTIIFSFSVLLHEVIHKAVFIYPQKHTTIRNIMGHLYASITGMSYTQFSTWHLEHHRHLGSSSKDPKRAKLSPKKNSRLLKILYATPALFFIYFRAVRQTIRDYPLSLQRKIKKERMLSVGLHTVWLLILLFWDFQLALFLSVIPVFFGFPLAFFVNRMGQHYVIDPDDPAKHSTLMLSNPAWDFLFLYSTYHLEHHYFPDVPFYNLKKTQKALKIFYKERGIKAYSYSQIFSLWIRHNHFPHSKPIKKA